MGSGSTAIAAKELRRDWIGIEISKDYCKIANERIKNWLDSEGSVSEMELAVRTRKEIMYEK